MDSSRKFYSERTYKCISAKQQEGIKNLSTIFEDLHFTYVFIDSGSMLILGQSSRLQEVDWMFATKESFYYRTR